MYIIHTDSDQEDYTGSVTETTRNSTLSFNV